MAKTKVFELDSYIDSKTKEVSRRFIDQLSYLVQKDYFQYKNPCIAASHILREDGVWEQWNGNGWSKTDKCIIVKDLSDLNIQEL
jgi:hypothetical protein